jgi:hypothetical protein
LRGVSLFVGCADPDYRAQSISDNLIIKIDGPIRELLDLITSETKNLVHILEAVWVAAEG